MGPERQVGPYELVRRLGAGGYGDVWMARQRATGAIHALKLVALGDAASILRFEREGVAAARLGAHPHAVQVHGSFVEGGRGVLVTELVEGGIDLQARLIREGPLAQGHAIQVVREVATAVAHGHAAGVLHRDLKPANVLLDVEGRARLIDMGLADLVSERSLTQTGEILGTPAYMAPEQALGRAVGPRVDVFGLGALLFACLTGQPPRRAGPVLETLVRAATTPVPPLRSLRPGLPSWLEEVVVRATALDPLQRFPTVLDFVAALDGTSSPLPRRTGRAQALAGMALLGALAVLIGVVRRPAPVAVAPARPSGAQEWTGAAAVRELLGALEPAGESAKVVNPIDLSGQLVALASSAPPEARRALGPEVASSTRTAQERLFEAIRSSGAETAEEEDRWADQLKAIARVAEAFGQGKALADAREPLWTKAGRSLSDAAAKGDARVLVVGRGIRAMLRQADPHERDEVGALLAEALRCLQPESPEELSSAQAFRLEAARRLLLGFPCLSSPSRTWTSQSGVGTGIHHLVIAIRNGSVRALQATGTDNLPGWKQRDLHSLRLWREACPLSRSLAWAELWLRDKLERREDAERLEVDPEARAAAALLLADTMATADVGDLRADRGLQVEDEVEACRLGLDELIRQRRWEGVERLGRLWLDKNLAAPPSSPLK